jgi:Bacterial PH domain
MSYVSGIRQPGERVLAVGRLHWIIYKDAAIAALLALVSFWFAHRYRLSDGAVVMWGGAGLLLLAAAACMAAAAWFDQWITEIAVTNLRVVYKRGFIRRHTAEMNMDKIESVTVSQSILGRILDYGTIHVRGTGEGIEHLHKVRAPIELRNCITAR